MLALRATIPVSLVSVFFVSLMATKSLACTVVSLPHSKGHLVGKSYDWDTERGLIMVNKRNVEKTALVLDPVSRPTSWVSQYGSVSFNQYGREFPLGGMNEVGLVVEIAWLDETEYPVSDERPALNELQWVQYQLDRFGSVEEVIDHAEEYRIVPAYANVHYLVCDAEGSCASFEYLKGHQVIHAGRDLDLPLLTNDIYSVSRKEISAYSGFGGSKALPSGQSSFARFARAARLAQATPAQSPEGETVRLMQLLGAVGQGGFTKWNIAYSSQSGQISFRSLSASQVKELNTKNFDYSCKKQVLTFPVVSKDAGQVDGRFQIYSYRDNRSLIEETLADIKKELPKGIIEVIADYPDTTRCLE